MGRIMRIRIERAMPRKPSSNRYAGLQLKRHASVRPAGRLIYPIRHSNLVPRSGGGEGELEIAE